MVIRDYIPEGAEPTMEEKQRFGLGEWKDLKSGIKPDFIPAPDHERVKSARELGKDPATNHLEISQAILKRGEGELKETFERAMTMLPGLTVQQALKTIEQLPGGLRGAWLLAEEAGLARKTILSRFPVPDDSLRVRLSEETK